MCDVQKSGENQIYTALEMYGTAFTHDVMCDFTAALILRT